MDGKAWLGDIRKLYRDSKEACERAAAQVGDEDYFRAVGGNPTSIAILLKHVGGNHRSRWRDFLTSDGEKADRNRETEFTAEGETRASVMEQWEAGWSTALGSLDALGEGDLDRTITIRGEPLTVVQAIHRNYHHVSYHQGQIVHLARQLVGAAWQPLSIPPGKSEEYNARMRAKYGKWD